MSQLLLHLNWHDEMENSNYYDLSDIDDIEHLFEEVKKKQLII
jgi:hypothetical protein